MYGVINGAMPRHVGTLDGDVIAVDDRSQCTGLAPPVVGLLEGLGELYGTPARVVKVAAVGASADHDTFLVRLGG